MHTFVFRILLIAVAGLPPVFVCVSQPRPTAAVHGRITDDSTHTPLASVNVFIAGTTISTASDTTGSYTLKKIPYGTHTLIVSLVGYETATRTLVMTKPSDEVYNFKLKPRVYSIPVVEITERFDESWQERLREFSREFIGTSLNARSCRITNPEVLDFRVDTATGALTASASRPLSIENDALGYHIMAILDDFEASPGSIRYSTHLLFEKLRASDSSVEFVRTRNRLLTYRCSLRYFLYSVINHACAANGFIVEKSEGPAWPGTLRTGLNRPDLIAVRGDSLERQINFPGFLRVTYQNENEPAEYGAFRRANGDQTARSLEYQTSWIEMKSTHATIDANGNLIYPYALKTYGFWAFQRIADTLPEDYEPNEAD